MPAKRRIPEELAHSPPEPLLMLDGSTPALWPGASFSLSAIPWGRGTGRAQYQDMGNTLVTAHGLHFWFHRGHRASLINGWAHGSGIVIVEMSDQERPKIDGLHVRFDGLETNALSDECFANKSFSTLPFDLAVAADLTLRPGCRITQNRSVFEQAPQTLAIPASGHLLSQRLMGTH